MLSPSQKDGLKPGPRSRVQVLLLRSLATGLLLLIPSTASAGAGTALLNAFVMDRVIGPALIVFGALSLLGGFYYGFRLIVSANNESALSEAGNSIVYAVFGFAVIALALPFSEAFGNVGGINTAILIPGIASLVQYITIAGSGSFVFMLTIIGIRILSTQGDSSKFEQHRKILLVVICGAGLMLLANSLVLWVSTGSPAIMIMEMAGLAIFLLTIIGVVSVVSIIAAGVMLIVSVDDSLKERAKRIIFGTLISLAFVLAAYTLIVTFV